MARSNTTLALALYGASLAPAALGQCPLQQLNPGSPADVDFFGWAISVDGDTALIGSPRDDEPLNNAGSVSVFERNGGEWAETDILRPGDPGASAYFGTSVCHAGDLALIGALGAGSQGELGPGAVYVFERSGGSWRETGKLVPTTGEYGDQFGYSVALADGWLLVGAPGSPIGGMPSEQGRVHTYEKTASGWVEGNVLTRPGPPAFDFFGQAVSVEGDTAVVGAWLGSSGGPSGAGSVFVFKRVSGQWELFQELLPDGLEYQDRFGFAVSIADRTILAAAYFDDDFGTNAGAVYVFDRVGSAWMETMKLVPESPFSTYFGWSVDHDDDLALVGAPGAGPDAPGRAYLFRRMDGEWISLGSLATGISFGRSAVLAGNEAFLSSDDGPAGENAGTVHVFGIGGETASYCVGSPSSAGAGARISSFGTASVACNDFTLWVSGAPPQEFGKFYYGPEAIQQPFGNGQACVGGGATGVFRLLPALPSDELGVFSRLLDFTAGPADAGPGQILPGSTWYFQYWYRDPAAGGAYFNLSDGLRVTFAP